MSPKAKFLTEIVLPWEALNERLAVNYAVAPGLSVMTTDAANIATALKHQVDVLAQERGKSSRSDIQKIQIETDVESVSSRLMSDIADMYKHVKTTRLDRANSFNVTSYFECSLEKFRFWRNKISVTHASLGIFDFMESASAAISYWDKKRNLNLNWAGSIRSAAGDFYDSATLIHDVRFVVEMDKIQIAFVTKDSNGDWLPFNPPEVRFAVMGAIQPGETEGADFSRQVVNLKARQGEWIDVETDAAPPNATAMNLLFDADKGLIIGKIRIRGSDVVASFSTDVNNVQGVMVRNVPTGRDGRGPAYPIVLQFVILEQTHPEASLNIRAAGYS